MTKCSPWNNELNFWEYPGLLPHCPGPDYRLPVDFTPSPIVTLDHQDYGQCLLKREDLNPSGSHKDRAAVFQVSLLRQNNTPAAVIPSSGNAALAVARHMKRIGGKTLAFMSCTAVPGKIQAVAAEGALLFVCEKPVNFAGYTSRVFNLPNLRPSLDPHAVTGFMTLGFEIVRQMKNRMPDALFIFSTSGATLLGMARAFHALNTAPPQLHAVQSGKAQSLVEEFDPRGMIRDNASSAGIGGLTKSRLFEAVAQEIRNSNGSAWGISPEETLNASQLLTMNKIDTSPEGATALAAVKRWRLTGGTGNALVILTGRNYSVDPRISTAPAMKPTTYLEVRDLVKQCLKQ